MQEWIKNFTKIKVQLVIIVLITFLAYSNILQNDFLADDRAFILQWDLPRDIRNIPNLFISKTNPPGLPQDYRPVRTTLLVLSYQLWGTNPVGYHFESMIIHLIITILVYFITKELVLSIKYHVLRKDPLIHNTYYIIPFLTALLFGLHPIHTEVVDYVMVSFNTVSVAFLLLSFYLYLKTLKKLSVAFFLLALFTYEIALVLPFLIMLYDFCFKTIKKNYLKNFSLRYLPYFFSVFLFLWIRAGLAGMGNAERGQYLLGSFYLNMLIMPKLIWKYIELLVFPLNLSFIHRIAKGFETYPTPYSNFASIQKMSILSPEVILPSLVLLVLVIILFWSLKKFPVIFFCLGWFFISMFPFFNLIPIGVTFSERYTYLASVGFVILITYLFHICYYRIRWKKLAVLLLVLILIFLFFRTYIRNYDWRNMETFTKSILRVNSESLIARYNLALYYKDTDPGQAVLEYRKLLEIDPRVKEAHFDLANVYLATGYIELAALEFNRTLTLDSNFIDAYIALGQINLSKGQLNIAEEYFKKALNVDPRKYLLFQLPKNESEIAISRSQALAGLQAVKEKLSRE